MAALEDDAISIIGVYGMGGVGKTTLVKEVAGQAKEKLSFDEVVFVAVTQTLNTMKFQNEIANQLGLELDKDPSEHVRAAKRRDRLKKAKKIHVILDDLWNEQEVDTLGIPSADQHKRCKMLMTSRSLDLLRTMDSHPNIPIEILKEDEAWSMFKKMAGQIVERPELQYTAFQVAKRCAGLPIAIATIAKALKPKENLFEWRDALRQLSNPSERNFTDVPADAYSAIELSYKFLQGEELGPIFLLCSIMGHNAAVEDLLRYAIGLGFIHDVNTMEEARNRVLTLVGKLKASCLLLEGSQPNCFDMHDVVSDVAQSIASRDRQWLALFKEWPDEEKMKESQLISLQNAEFSCPALEELEVRDCHKLKYVFTPSMVKSFVQLKTIKLLFGCGEISSEHPLFWVNESTFPNLHQITLESNAEMKEMIFQSEKGGEEKPASLLLSQITELRLYYLPANLVPSSVSFRNLLTLEVESCGGIIKLITDSTAKSLVQLKEMSIKGCKNIQDIIQGGDDDDDEISFPHLNRLELYDLPKLESFCSSETYTFSFPSLESLRVENCPNMRRCSLNETQKLQCCTKY